MYSTHTTWLTTTCISTSGLSNDLSWPLRVGTAVTRVYTHTHNLKVRTNKSLKKIVLQVVKSSSSDSLDSVRVSFVWFLPEILQTEQSDWSHPCCSQSEFLYQPFTLYVLSSPLRYPAPHIHTPAVNCVQLLDRFTQALNKNNLKSLFPRHLRELGECYTGLMMSVTGIRGEIEVCSHVLPVLYRILPVPGILLERDLAL